MSYPSTSTLIKNDDIDGSGFTLDDDDVVIDPISPGRERIV